MVYSYMTWAALRTQLASRLNDPSKLLFTDAELKTALAESMRVWNCLTGYWRERTVFQTSAGIPFYDLPSLAKDENGALARPYTVTDLQVITEMCSHLMEPSPSGSPLTWQGTEMFSLDDLVKALERRRNQFLMDTGCVVTHFTQNVPPTPVGRVQLPDSTILIRRAAWCSPVDPAAVVISDPWGIPWQIGVDNDGMLTATQVSAPSVPFVLLSDGVTTWQLTALSYMQQAGRTAEWMLTAVPSQPAPTQILCTQPNGATAAISIVGEQLTTTLGATPGTGYQNLYAEDEFSASGFQNSWTTNPAKPKSYSVAAVSPLQLQLIPIPSDKGALDLLAVQAPAALNPSTGILLGIPDDLVWAIKWGALADLLNRDSEANDAARAVYCESRYEQGVQLAKIAQSALRVQLNDVPLAMGSVAELDAFSALWQSGVGVQDLQGKPWFAAMAGMNLVALSKVPDQTYAVSVDLVANAPVPTLDSDFVPLGREQLDALLDFAQHTLSFKEAGQEFAETKQLMQNMLRVAGVDVAQLKALSLYADVMREQAQEENQMRPRGE